MLLRIAMGLIFLFNLTPVYAWNWVGHEAVAQIAYTHLTPEVRKKVDAIVGDFSSEYSNVNSFIEMAPWPDSLHAQKIEIYNHWHYINQAYSDDNTTLKDLRGTDNIIRAIGLIEPIVKNPHANTFEKARFLAFLVHFVGDIHQPLHAITRISASHPNGDEGGNLFLIRNTSDSKGSSNLHKVWEGCNLFSLTNEDAVKILSEKIEKDYPEAYFADSVNDLKVEDWANESFIVGKNFVYKTEEGQPLSHAYIEEGQQLAEQRVALAGYRLARVLNGLLS